MESSVTQELLFPFVLWVPAIELNVNRPVGRTHMFVILVVRGLGEELGD